MIDRTPPRPRDKNGVLDAAILLARDKGFETAETRLQDELHNLPSEVTEKQRKQEKNALQYGLGQLRKAHAEESRV